MKKKLQVLFAGIIVASSAVGVNIQLFSSTRNYPLPLPEGNGSFSEISSEGFSVRHLYYIISEEDYIGYTNAASPSIAIFEDFLTPEKTIGEVCLYDEIVTSGSSELYLDEIPRYYDVEEDDDVCYDTYFGYNTNACFAAIYIYTNDTAVYYIAEPLCLTTPTREEAEVSFKIPFIPNIALNAGRWEVIYNEPPSITCTDLCVTGGVVSATYSISEFSRLNEIVSNEETSVIVAADLARTTQTNLAASVTATNSGESTFTFSFNPAEQNWTNSTLFIFGVESPR